jgi:hypothetical protein
LAAGGVVLLVPALLAPEAAAGPVVWPALPVVGVVPVAGEPLLPLELQAHASVAIMTQMLVNRDISGSFRLSS